MNITIIEVACYRAFQLLYGYLHEGDRYGLVLNDNRCCRLVCVESLDSSAYGSANLNVGQLPASA